MSSSSSSHKQQREMSTRSEHRDENATRSFWTDRMLSNTRSMRQRDLALHLGDKQDKRNNEVIPTIADLAIIKQLDNDKKGHRLYYQATDHFLRSRVEPLQAMLTTWMDGAKAQVGGQDIPFNQVVTWCQHAQDAGARSDLTREVRSLCRFLAPFSHATWKALIEVLTEELYYPDYLTYCEEKRDLSLHDAAAEASAFLKKTSITYRRLLQPLLFHVTGLSLEQASRFDAIYLLGLRYLDHFFPDQLHVSDILAYFQETGYPLVAESEQLVIHEKDDPGVQPYCIPVDIPGEVHIILGPLKGWLDLESLCHELGHALSFLYADAGLPTEQSDFFQSGGLSESFAFLFQKICMSKEFLQEVLSVDRDIAQMIAEIHGVKWLTLSRRYAAKLAIEGENFQHGYLQRGEKYYADTMQKETGFYYDPETYLFDLMPDFYTLDYFQAFLGSAALEHYLRDVYGKRWYLEPEASGMLKQWWREGNSQDLSDFMKKKTGSPLHSGPFVRNISALEQAAVHNFSF